MSEKQNKNKKPIKGEKPTQKKDENQAQKKNEKPNKGQKSQKKADKNAKPQVNPVKQQIPPKKVVESPIENISKPVPTESARGKYSRRKIESNWDRLELPENIYEITTEQSRKTNLEEIFKRPISLGGHFQFKHEKSWNFVEKDVENNELFALNLKDITEHLLCVPFHELLDLESNLFSDKQIESMVQTANSNKLKYGIHDDEDINNLKNILSKDLSSLSLKNDDTESPSKAGQNTDEFNDSDELDRILKLTGPICTGFKVSDPDNRPLIGAVIDPDDNLEDWLDEFI